MKQNIGSIDRSIRLLIAAALIILLFNNILTDVRGIAAMTAAIMLTVTSFIGVCPLYSALEITTNPIESQN